MKFTSKKINFIAILRQLLFIKNEVAPAYFENLKVYVDCDENCINLIAGTTNVYKIYVTLELGFDPIITYYKPVFMLMDMCHQYDTGTGFWNEKEYPEVSSLFDVYSQLIAIKYDDYQVHQYELHMSRKQGKLKAK